MKRMLSLFCCTVLIFALAAIEAYAKGQGKSVNGFITGLIHERMNLTAPEKVADEEQA